ncbi:MAG: hypothetical protein ACQEP7_00160 [bacterium]
MVEVLTLLVLYICDWLLEFIGIGGFLLLLFPLFLFFRSYSTPKILFGGLVAGLLAEMIHGYLAGSLLIGLGVAILAVQATKPFIQWQLFTIRGLGIVVFLIIVFFLRGAVIFVLGGAVVPPDLSALVMTFLAGFIILPVINYFNSGSIHRL